MFKRPRLRPTSPIVNASLAASVIFLAACSGDKTETGENIIENKAPTIVAENADAVILQAVWATSPLTDPITSLAFVGGSEPILAVSLSTGALQLFNLQGDRITAPVELDIKTLGTGQAVVLNQAALTLFPGIGTNGDLNLYAYASALGDPLRLDFLPDINAAGLCAGPPLDGTSVMQLAYWTVDKPTELIHGHVKQDSGGELDWSLLDTQNSANGPITACLADAQLEVATTQTAIDLALLSKYGERYLIAHTADGTLNIIDQDGKTRPATVNNGISVRAPSPASAMAALSEARFGNYPNGLLVLGGPVNGSPQITLIEPGNLFKNPQ